MDAALNITNATAPGYTTVGGIVPIKSIKQLQEEERAAAVTANSSPVVQNLAAYIKQKWMYARMAKEYTIEQQMLKCVRQRRSVQYDGNSKHYEQHSGGPGPVHARLRDYAGSEFC